MVRVAMGRPEVRRPGNGVALRLGDLVREGPAPEVRASGDPGIGDQERRAVVEDEGRVADRLEADIHLHRSASLPRGERGIPSNSRTRGLPGCAALEDPDPTGFRGDPECRTSPPPGRNYRASGRLL